MSLTRDLRRLWVVPRALPAGSARKAGTIALLGGICLLPVLLYIPFLNEPFMRDEGFYASVAQSILDGGVPYRDAFDHKPPLVFAWYALSFLLFGENVWAPRLLVSLLLSLTTLLVYVQGRVMFSHRFGLVAAAAFGLSLGLATMETNANAEFFMLLPLVGALVSFTLGQRSGRPGWFALCGFLSGIAVATKTVSLFTIPLFLALIVWPHIRRQGIGARRRGELWARTGAILAGCALATLLVVAPFIVTGSLDELFESTVVFTVQYVGAGSSGNKLSQLARMPVYLLFLLGPWLVLAALGLRQIVRRGGGGYGPLLTGWLAVNWLGIVVPGRFFDHYFVSLMPALSLILPLGLKYLRENWPSALVKVTVFACLPLTLVIPLMQNTEIYFQRGYDERHSAKYTEDSHAAWENQGPEFGAWLRRHTAPADNIYNLGYQSELYFFADRASPTRFLSDRAFWYASHYQDEAVEELSADPPLYVIDSAVYEDKPDLEYHSGAVRAWIKANYDYVGKVYYADVWMLKGGAD